MKIVTVVGARPQFVKASVVSAALATRPHLQELLVHTGQHYDDSMSRIFFEELGLPAPDFELMVGSGTHGAQTGRMLEGIEGILLRERPDITLVYGDTNSTIAGALASAKLHIPVAHVEAGLRSFNRQMPEEINRVLTDHIADLLFAPTTAAVGNLEREGLSTRRIHQVGDVMLDVALSFGELAERESHVLERLTLTHGSYVLATVHRAENTDDPVRLSVIMAALVELAADYNVVVPLHPRTLRALEGSDWLHRAGRLRLLEPVGYLDMTMLERHAGLIITDSGGVQKEAFFHRVPCVTLRDETEWIELVELGWNRLAPPTTTEGVLAAVRLALASPFGKEGDPYGSGHTAETIASYLAEWPSG